MYQFINFKNDGIFSDASCMSLESLDELSKAQLDQNLIACVKESMERGYNYYSISSTNETYIALKTINFNHAFDIFITLPNGEQRGAKSHYCGTNILELLAQLHKLRIAMLCDTDMIKLYGDDILDVSDITDVDGLKHFVEYLVNVSHTESLPQDQQQEAMPLLPWMSRETIEDIDIDICTAVDMYPNRVVDVTWVTEPVGRDEPGRDIHINIELLSEKTFMWQSDCGWEANPCITVATPEVLVEGGTYDIAINQTLKSALQTMLFERYNIVPWGNTVSEGFDLDTINTVNAQVISWVDNPTITKYPSTYIFGGHECDYEIRITIEEVK